MRVTTLFITLTAIVAVLYAMTFLFNIIFGVIHHTSQYIDNITSTFTNATVVSPMPSNFDYTVSSFASNYAVWAVVVLFAGIAIIVAYSIKR